MAAESRRFRYASGQGEITPLDPEEAQRWCDALLTNKNLVKKLEYWTENRGISTGTIQKLQIGWNPQKRRYTIPVYSAAGKLVDIKLYRPGELVYGKSIHYTETREGVEMRWGSPVRLYGIDQVAKLKPGKGRLGVVLVVAGEPDKALAEELGYIAVSPTSGEGALCRREDIEVVLKGGWPVRVMMDTDKAGREAADLWLNALSDIGVTNLKDIVLPLEEEDGKDLTDWYRLQEKAGGGAGLALWEIVRATSKWEADTSRPEPDGAKRGKGNSAKRTRKGKGGVRRPIEELLQLAVANIEETGSRNKAGFFFWCQLRDERYTREEAIQELDGWVEAANRVKPGPPAYSKKESTDSLEEAYRHPPREANGFKPEFHTTDLGNARRFLSRFGDDVAWVPSWADWTTWNESHWLRSTAKVELMAREVPEMILEEAESIKGPSKVKSSLKKWSVRSEAAGTLSAMMRLAQAEVTVPFEDFDADPRILNLRNGTLVLGETLGDGDKGISFRNHQRSDFASIVAPVDWVPGLNWKKQGKAFTSFISETLPDPDELEYLQRLIGYSLLGTNHERKFVVIQGPTASGKSTLSNLLHRVFRGYVETFRLSLLREKQEEGPRPDIVTLMPKRMIIASEAATSWHLHADQVKSVTGNEPITARQMQAKEYVTRVPSFTPFLLTNQIPQIREADEALWRRLIALKFGVTRAPEDEDHTLENRIVRDESSAVLAWAIEGYRAYLKKGLGDIPLSIIQHTKDVREQMTDLDQWLSLNCDTNPEYTATIDELHQNYQSWCFTHGLSDRDKLSRQAFIRGLEARRFTRGSRRRSGPAGPANIDTWFGIRLAKEEAENGVR